MKPVPIVETPEMTGVRFISLIKYYTNFNFTVDDHNGLYF